MLGTILLDSVGPVTAMFVAAVFGGSLLLAGVLIAAATVLEAYILYRLKWGTKQFCFLAALTVNGLSASVGALELLYMPSIQEAVLQNIELLILALFFMVNFIITLLVETPVLVLLNPDEMHLSLRASLRMNIISYLMYVVVLSLQIFAFSM
jgi:hypothetical protein